VGVQSHIASWHWSDEAKIEPDGTFVFESLPRDEVVQMIPICDRWMPAKPNPKDVFGLLPVDRGPKDIERKINHFAATPQVAKAQGESIEVVLGMVAVPSLAIEVTDEDGKPLEGIALGTSPNQYWFNSGSQILGESTSSRKSWELSKQSVNMLTFEKASLYQKKTDENGVAIFKTMPPGTHEFYIFGKDFEMAKESETGEKTSIRVTIEDENQKLNIKMKPSIKASAVGSSK